MNSCDGSVVGDRQANVSYYYTFTGDDESTVAASVIVSSKDNVSGESDSPNTLKSKKSRSSFEPPGRSLSRNICEPPGRYFGRRKSKLKEKSDRPCSPPAFRLESDFHYTSPIKRNRGGQLSNDGEITTIRLLVEQPAIVEPDSAERPTSPSPTAKLINESLRGSSKKTAQSDTEPSSLKQSEKSSPAETVEQLKRPDGPNPAALLVADAFRNKKVAAEWLNRANTEANKGLVAEGLEIPCHKRSKTPESKKKSEEELNGSRRSSSARRRNSTGSSADDKLIQDPTKATSGKSRSNRARSPGARPSKSTSRSRSRSKSNDQEPSSFGKSLSSFFERSPPSRSRSRSCSQRASRTAALKPLPSTPEKRRSLQSNRSETVRSTPKPTRKGSLTESIAERKTPSRSRSRSRSERPASPQPQSRNRSTHQPASRLQRNRERGSSKTPKPHRARLSQTGIQKLIIPRMDHTDREDDDDDDQSICLEQLKGYDSDASTFVGSSLQLDISNPCLVETMVVEPFLTGANDGETDSDQDDMLCFSQLLQANHNLTRTKDVGISAISELSPSRRLRVEMV